MRQIFPYTFPLTLSLSTPLPVGFTLLIQLGGLGSSVSYPKGSWQSPAATQVMVHFELTEHSFVVFGTGRVPSHYDGCSCSCYHFSKNA